jgi:hypothetical protein
LPLLARARSDTGACAASVGRLSRPAGAPGLVAPAVGRAATEGAFGAARPCDDGLRRAARVARQFWLQAGLDASNGRLPEAARRRDVRQRPRRVSRDDVPRRCARRTTRTTHDAARRCGHYPRSAGRRPGDRMRPARGGAVVGRRVMVLTAAAQLLASPNAARHHKVQRRPTRAS